MLRRYDVASRMVKPNSMKTALQYLFLLLPLLAISQERTITDEKSQLVLSDGVYYEVITTEYETGPPLIVPVKIGGSAATLSYLQAWAVNRQQEVARAQRKVIEEKTLGFRQFLGLDTLVKDITNVEAWIYKNNAEVGKSHSIATVITAGNIVNIGKSAIVELSENDYIELFYDASNTGDVISYTSSITLEKI